MSDSGSPSSLEALKPVNADKEWERKQRSREYRVAARREKRNRKADEKKQRKLNATILRRMVRGRLVVHRSRTNDERNRLREVELERRKIRSEAVRQAERLAAIHDSSGVIFNVGAVVTLSDGSVISREALRRRQDRLAEKIGETAFSRDSSLTDEESKSKSPDTSQPIVEHVDEQPTMNTSAPTAASDGLYRSKSQLKKLAKYAPRPPPPRPTIPNNICLFEGEVDWLSLWDLDDQEIERRIVREKRRKVTARKALRMKQQFGKAERRMARDEKRAVYRDLKLEWKMIREETRVNKKQLQALENEESKKIAVSISSTERQRALECCRQIDVTLENTPGVNDVIPRAMGMKGLQVDFDSLQRGDRASELRPRPKKRRVDLGGLLDDAQTQYVSSEKIGAPAEIGEFVDLDVGDGADFERLQYNHRVRRKLVRAMERADVEKEMVVRRFAIEQLERKGADPPAILLSEAKPINVKGQRILENGVLETAKQERVRSRMDLADFNEHMRVLRRQAKEVAIYAGLRKHAEVSGRLQHVPETNID